MSKNPDAEAASMNGEDKLPGLCKHSLIVYKITHSMIVS